MFENGGRHFLIYKEGGQDFLRPKNPKKPSCISHRFCLLPNNIPLLHLNLEEYETAWKSLENIKLLNIALQAEK